jgi:hypothetical protein
MALSERQERSYIHLCDLWQPTDGFDGNGDPEGRVYVLAVAAVPCRFVPKSAVDIATQIGRMESDDLQTVDSLRLPEDSPAQSGWIAVQVTPGHGDYGKAWIVRGSPKRRISAPGRPAGRVVAYFSKEPDNTIPEEILEHYA